MLVYIIGSISKSELHLLGIFCQNDEKDSVLVPRSWGANSLFNMGVFDPENALLNEATIQQEQEKRKVKENENERRKRKLKAISLKEMKIAESVQETSSAQIVPSSPEVPQKKSSSIIKSILKR